MMNQSKGKLIVEKTHSFKKYVIAYCSCIIFMKIDYIFSLDQLTYIN